MTSELVVTVLTIIGSILGGAFGVKLLDRWFDRDKDSRQALGRREDREFADNEQARRWLSEQLNERDDDLKAVRESERALLKEVGELRAEVRGQAERLAAQAIRIDDLSTTVSRLGSDYAEMKKERDEYRSLKHEADQRITSESLARQLAEKNLESARQEIERLRGQVQSLTKRGGES